MGNFKKKRLDKLVEQTPTAVLAGNDPFLAKTYKIEEDS